MPASKSSSSGGSRGSGRARSTGSGSPRSRASSSSDSEATGETQSATRAARPDSGKGGGVTEGVTSFIEQMVNLVINPLGLVVLTRERIQDTLDEAAARGRLTQSDANEIAAELVRRGRVQTDELIGDAERLMDHENGEQIDSAGVRSRFSDGMERIVRTADRARRTVGVGGGVGPQFPIPGYDELTAAHVNARLKGLSPTELRRLREYERRHANRKSVLDAIERALS